MAERRPSFDLLRSLSVSAALGKPAGEEPGTGGKKTERRPSLEFLRSLSIGGLQTNGPAAPAGNGAARRGRRSSMRNLGERTKYDNPSDSTDRRSSVPSEAKSGKQPRRRSSFGSLAAFAKMDVKEVKLDGDLMYETALKKAKAQEWEGSIRLLNRTLIVQRKEYGQDHPKVASTLNSIGVALTNLGETFGAMTAFQEALYIRQETLGAGHEDVVKTMNNIHKLLDVVQLIDDNNADDDSEDESSEDEEECIETFPVQNNHGLGKYRDEESSDSDFSTDSDDDSDLESIFDDSDLESDGDLHVGFPSR